MLYSRASPFGSSGCDQDLALTLDHAAVLHVAIDFADDRGILRLAGFEQFDHARQAARDVLGLGRLARNLREHVAGVDHVAVRHHQVSAHRHDVAADGGAVGGLDLDRRLLLLIRRVDHDQARQARDFVEVLLDRDAVDDVLELDLPRFLREDRERVGIPLDQDLAVLDGLTVLDLQARAVDHLVALAVAALVVLHHDEAGAVHDDHVAAARRCSAARPSAGSRTSPRPCASNRASTDPKYATPCRRCGTCASSAACRARRSTARRPRPPPGRARPACRSTGRGRSSACRRRGVTRRSAPSGS